MVAQLTKEQATQLGITPEQLAHGEIRGLAKTYGEWQTIKSYTAQCITYEKDAKTKTFHGPRALTKTKPLGYALEGTVSFGNQKKRGFTSSVMISVDGGPLVEVAAIYI